VIALSSREAEYVVGSLVAFQANWLQSLIIELRYVMRFKSIVTTEGHPDDELVQKTSV
jgi:hypothetical protein